MRWRKKHETVIHWELNDLLHKQSVNLEERLRYLEHAVMFLGIPGPHPGAHLENGEGDHYPWQCSPGNPCWEGKPIKEPLC